MTLPDKEIIKKLAEAIAKENKRITDPGGSNYCNFCRKFINSGKQHKPNCPVLLAEEVLRDCEKCIHVGADNECNCVNGDKYEVKKESCPVCDNEEWTGWRTNGVCTACNGTGVKK